MLLRFKDVIINAAHIERIKPDFKPARKSIALNLTSGQVVVIENEEAECLLWLIDNKLLGVPTLDLAAAIKARPEIEKQLFEKKQPTLDPSAIPPPAAGIGPKEAAQILELLETLKQQREGAKNNVIPLPTNMLPFPTK